MERKTFPKLYIHRYYSYMAECMREASGYIGGDRVLFVGDTEEVAECLADHLSRIPRFDNTREFWYNGKNVMVGNKFWRKFETST